jgi:hypothetical protein
MRPVEDRPGAPFGACVLLFGEALALEKIRQEKRLFARLGDAIAGYRCTRVSP